MYLLPIYYMFVAKQFSLFMPACIEDLLENRSYPFRSFLHACMTGKLNYV